MFRSQGRIVTGMITFVFLSGLILLSCSTGPLGTQRENRPPRIDFSNIPPDGSAFSFNPEVSWYATDVDGYIGKYQFAVVVKDSLHVINSLWQGGGTLNSADSACSVLVRIPPEVWIDSLESLDHNKKFISAVETTTSIVRIQLFATEDPTDTITQYLFVRAIDDDDSTSNIIRRMFSRNNHKPKAHIDDSPFRFTNAGKTVKSVYCLPETTATWKGIKITWEGSDSQDYIGAQPNFLYKWELYGPFADTSIDPLDTTALGDSAQQGRLVDSSLNEGNSTPYVEDKSLLLKGLVNYPHTVPVYSYPDSGFGWYLFKVWSMDDAFVLSNPPGYMWFKVVHPQLTYQTVKKILVLDFAYYGSSPPAHVGGENYYDSTERYYVSAFTSMQNEGLCDSFSFRRYFADDLNDTIAKDILSRYNLLVYLNEGNSFGTYSSIAGASLNFREYMRVGGKIWVIGNSSSSFGLSFSLGEDALVDFSEIPGSSPDVAGADFAMTYFGLLGVYNSGWTYSTRNEEFVGAKPFGSFLDDLPTLRTDYNKTDYQVDWYGDANPPRLPHAGYSYLGRATRIYSFVSAYSTNSDLHDKPCGSVFEGPTYKTAYLSLGLHFTEEGPSGEVRDSLFREMLGWFWED